jgi:ABC-type Zn uptake system ZnuABC Zn-binding protein ZnuA
MYSSELVQLFRGEFIFPTEGLKVNLYKTLNALEADKVISTTRDTDADASITFIELSNLERESGRENFDFYCFLIWPFIEATWLGAISLMMLTPPKGQPEHVWHDVKRVQDQAQLVSE